MRLWLDLFGETSSASNHGPHGFVYCKTHGEVINHLKSGQVEEIALDSFDPKTTLVLNYLDCNPTKVTVSLRPTITTGVHPPHDAIQSKIGQLKRK
jgi:hypothetical protein